VRFKYGVIELHKIDAVELMETGLSGLLPLLPLTKDGARREIVDDMITTLVETERTESLWIGYALAAKVMSDDLSWLKWRFSMLGDFLRDSPVFQEVLEEGLEKGREEELQQEIQRERDALLDIIFERFPELMLQGKEVSNTIDDPAILLRLIVKMSTVPTAEEARQLLLALAQ
jgi:predicted transposase YdaD